MTASADYSEGESELNMDVRNARRNYKRRNLGSKDRGG